MLIVESGFEVFGQFCYTFEPSGQFNRSEHRLLLGE